MNPAASETDYPADHSRRWVKVGSEMGQEDKDLLEEQVAKSPNDVRSRIKLLGYYFNKGWEDAEAKSNKEGHLVWLIENSPELKVLGSPYGRLDMYLEPQGYHRAAQAWKKLLSQSPENLAVLKNAAEFFWYYDCDLSEELLLKGQILDAKAPNWSASLGELYFQESVFKLQGVSRKATAKKAFEHYELAYQLSGFDGKKNLLTNLATSALVAGLNNEAKTFATMLLADDTDDWEYGNRIHYGNLVLGQIAFADGNIDQAKSRLLRAGQTSGSPQLKSFGPRMQLAKDLLECGACETVLEYFELCKTFWKSGATRLELWSDEVKASRIPQFESNLVY